MTDLTVGRFTLTDEGLLAPDKYMREQGKALLDAILAGEDDIFNMTANLSPNIKTAILVRLQNDYAGWVGVNQLLK